MSKYNWRESESFNTWARIMIGVSPMIILNSVSLILPLYLYPLISLLFASILMYYVQKQREIGSEHCNMVMYFVAYALIFTAIISAICYLLGYKFISILIIAPVFNLHILFFYFKHGRIIICSECVSRKGYPYERMLMGNTHAHETPFFLSMMYKGTLFISVVTWFYYGLFYININYNYSDRFTYVVMPLVTYLLFMLYSSIWSYSLYWAKAREVVGDAHADGNYTLIRCLVMHNNQLLVKRYNFGEGCMRSKGTIDTPIYSYRSKVNRALEYEVKELLYRKLNVDDIEVRFAYQIEDTATNSGINHFLAFVNDEQKKQIDALGYEWWNIDNVRNDINGKQKLSTYVSEEMRHLCVLMITAKKYHKDGRRKFPIKGYTPSVSFEDMRVMSDVLGDSSWFRVYVDNEDHFIFRLKRFFYKLFKIENIIK